MVRKADKRSVDLSMYAEPDSGWQRIALSLEPVKDETLLKVELVVGLEMVIDCNLHGLQGEFEYQTVKGWGYGLWKFKTNGEIVSTLMACEADSEHLSFVHGQSQLVRYNSKLPVVVYIPQGYELRWRVWETDGAYKKLKK